MTTTSAGVGPPGKARWVASRLCTTGMFVGRSCRPGSASRMLTAGTARAARASAAVPPNSTGLATTRRARADHTRDGRAAVRRRPRNGILPRSTQEPSSESAAGSAVSEPSTVMPTTMIVPTASPEKTSMPVRNSPASEIITVRPDTTMARPEVAAALRTAV